MTRKAIFIIKNGQVKEKRPSIDQIEDYRPFWSDRKSAEIVEHNIKQNRRTYYYKISDGKIKRSWSTTEVKPTKNLFTSREQLDEYSESVSTTIDYTITRGNISIFYNSKSYNITASDKRFGKLKKACLNNDNYGIIELIDLENKIKEVSDVKDGKILVQGYETPDNLAVKIVDIVNIDKSIIQKFNKRLSKNPSKSAHKNLLKFLNYHGCCFLDDGRFVAYKYVKDNFKDCFSGKLDYSPGSIVKMKRSEVVENPNLPCQSGLHVGTWEYVKSENTIVAVIVDPYDVVSVPNDYGHQKMRCCKVYSVCRIYRPIDKSSISLKELQNTDK